MPNMADITVKNAAAADVVYVSAMPSAGDKSPARWSQNAASGITGFRPSLEIVTRSNADQSVRRAEWNFRFPVTYTDSTTGKVVLDAPIVSTGVIFLPASLDTTSWNEAFVQLGNLLSSTLIRSVVQTGYAPT